MLLAHWDIAAQSFTAALTFGTAFLAWHARHHAKKASTAAVAIEDAVNHRHRHDGSPPRLYDVALENRRRLSEAEFNDVAQFEQLDRLEAAIQAHIEWEEGDDGKYDAILKEVQRLATSLEVDREDPE